MKTLGLLLTIMSLMLAACGSKDSGDYVATPNVDFECSIASAIGCDSANAGKTVYFGLDENLSLSCATKLAYLSGSQLITGFDFASNTVAIDQGGILVGIASQWVSGSQAPMHSLPKKSFKVCAFIDLNDNQQIDLNEPLHESTLNLSSDFLPLSAWTNY